MLIHKAIVIGGSGLVGTALLNTLISDSDFLEVHSIVRRSLADRPPRVREHIADFNHIQEWDIWALLDAHPDHHAVVFCCLGTTLKDAGTLAEYRRIDHDIPLAIAQAAFHHGVRHFVAISGALVKEPSANHFSRSKLDLERDLSQIGFPSLTIVKPSALLGKRTKIRWIEVVMKLIMVPLGPAIPARWRAVHDWQVAQAMTTAAMRGPAGVHHIHNDEIVHLRR